MAKSCAPMLKVSDDAKKTLQIRLAGQLHTNQSWHSYKFSVTLAPKSLANTVTHVL